MFNKFHYRNLRKIKNKKFFLKKPKIKKEYMDTNNSTSYLKYRLFKSSNLFLDKKLNYLSSVENSILNINKPVSENFKQITILLKFLNITKRYIYSYGELLSPNFNSFYRSNVMFRQVPFLLTFSFRRGRFFPSIHSLDGLTHTNSSLGMFSVFLNKGKSFIKNKSNYVVSSSFLRKLIVYAGIKDLYLIVKHIPIYINEIISSLNKPSINFYKDPFSGSTVTDIPSKQKFFFSMFMFFNNKPYGFMKGRKRGRIKRKITKRLVSINNLVD